MRTIRLDPLAAAFLLPLALATTGSGVLPQEPGAGSDPASDDTRAAVQALTEALRDSSAPVRWTSASMLEEIGPAAAPASCELVRLLGERGSENYGPRLHAEKALVAIGRGAVPSLLAVFRGEDPEVQAVVCGILAEIGPDAGTAAVPALLKALDDPDLRWHAALALAGIEQEPASSVPVLVEILRSGSPDRGRALRALANYGAGASAALPGILAMFEAAGDDLRRSAAVALSRAAPRSSEADRAIAYLLEQLNHQSPAVRKAAVRALGEIGFGRREVLPALLAKVEDGSLEERRAAVHALGTACTRTGTEGHPERSAALEALIRLLRRNDRQLWMVAVEALGRVGRDAQTATADIRRTGDELTAEAGRLPKELAGLAAAARKQIAQALRRIEGSGAETAGPIDVAGADPAAGAMETEVQAFLRSPERLGFRALGPNPQGFAEFRHLQTGMVFVLVPGGKVVVGTSPRPEQTGNRRPQRELTVAPFLMGKYEVTQAQWQAVMGKNPSWFQGPRAPEGRAAGELPVENVRFDSILKFCEMTGLFLPTVPEWEFACHGAAAEPPGEVDRQERGWFAENSGGSIHPVGKKKSNGYGLHDLYGNVWEYCGPIWHLNGFTYYGRPGPEKLRHSTGWCPELQGGSFRDPSGYTGSPLHPPRPFLMTEEPPWHSGFRAVFPLRESERTRP